MPLDPKYFGEDGVHLSERETYLFNLLSPLDACRVEDIIDNQLYCFISVPAGKYVHIDFSRYLQHPNNPYYFLALNGSQGDYIYSANKGQIYHCNHYDVSETTLSLLLLKYPEIKIPRLFKVSEYYKQRDYANATYRS